jgi:hypothetical protein
MELTDTVSSSRLKLSSKRLKSGKVQVKFQLSSKLAGGQYGYLLADPQSSLKEVVMKILDSYDKGMIKGYHHHLFNVGRAEQNRDVILFK